MLRPNLRKIFTVIRLAVFDVAGTTVYDPDGVGRALKEALTAAHVPWEAPAVNEVMGIFKPVAIRMLLERFSPELANDEMVHVVHEDFRSRMQEYYQSSDEVRPIEGAIDTFMALKAAGVKVALDTGFDRAVLDSVLGRLGWSTGLLDATVASDEVAQGRPFPDLIYRAMELTGVTDVKQVAKIGDTPSDLQEGTNAGCALVVGVTKGTHTAEQLAAFPHTHLIGTVADFPALIAGSLSSVG
jgi:phosphonatase-like hydrolase